MSWETGSATDYRDLLEKLHTFLTAKGSAFGVKAGANTGTGTLTGFRGGASAVAQTFTLTATSATSFTVVGSVSGSIGPATVGTPFAHAAVEFTLNAGGTAFVSGDSFTFATAPKWTAERRARGATVVASSVNTGQNAGENVLDGKEAYDSSRHWGTISGTQSLEFTFLEAETIAEYAIMASTGGNPTAWTLDYWNGSTWVTLDSRSSQTSWGDGVFNTYAVASPVSATLYRLNFTAWSASGQVGAVELRRATGGFNAAFGQYIWKAPGNDGASSIYVGIHSFRRADVDYHDWELAAMDGYVSSAEFYAQPNVHRETFVPLWNSAMTYWFVSNGRRVLVLAKLGSQYEVAYLGLLEPYFTPGQAPYPMAIGGSLARSAASAPLWNDTFWRYSNGNNEHRAFTHSDPSSGTINQITARHQMRVRKLDGSYEGCVASRNDAFAPNAGSDSLIWPYHGDFNTLDVNLDGTYPLFPVFITDATPNTFGQLDGVRATTGQGLTAETLIRDGAVDTIAIPNITRTDRNDWLTMRLD